MAAGNLRKHFDTTNAVVRRAYYRLTNLIASEQAKSSLSAGRHVVMDRYWTSTVAFSAMDEGNHVANLGGVRVGGYPEELRVPDVVVLLTVNAIE